MHICISSETKLSLILSKPTLSHYSCDQVLPMVQPDAVGPTCLSLCLQALSWLNCQRYRHKIWPQVHLDNILDKFGGQCHRSKVKVTRLENMTFREFCSLILSWVIQNPSLWCDVMTSYGVTAWRYGVMAWRKVSWHDIPCAKGLWNAWGDRSVNVGVFSNFD